MASLFVLLTRKTKIISNYAPIRLKKVKSTTSQQQKNTKFKHYLYIS